MDAKKHVDGTGGAKPGSGLYQVSVSRCFGQATSDDNTSRPDLISLVISDVGILTPEGVSHYLVGMFAG